MHESINHALEVFYPLSSIWVTIRLLRRLCGQDVLLDMLKDTLGSATLARHASAGAALLKMAPGLASFAFPAACRASPELPVLDYCGSS